MTHEDPSQRFGKYELIAHLATGGMAEIYLARQRGIAGFEKLLVIKKILPHLAREDLFIRMFLDEARIAARINHHNAVQIYDLGRVDEVYYIAMEYLEGESLAELIRQARRSRQPLSPAIAAAIMLQVCEGLHHAHTLTGPDGEPMQLVHRDVNPQNIFVLYTGGVKLVDFGIAKAANRLSDTSTGMLKGKFGYMAPEQIKGLPVDARADIFSAGVVLWELLTGRKLFRQKTEFEILRAVTEETPPKPSQVLASVPKELDAIALRALSRARELRYQSAGEMRLELAYYLKQRREPVDTLAVSEYVQTMFFERMMEKRRLIATAQRGSASMEQTLFGDLLPGESDTEPSVSPDTPPFAVAPEPPQPPAEPPLPAARTEPPWRLLALGLGLLLVLGMLGTWLAWPTPRSPAAAVPVVPPPTPPVAKTQVPEPAFEPPAPPAPTPAAEPPAAPTVARPIRQARPEPLAPRVVDRPEPVEDAPSIERVGAPPTEPAPATAVPGRLRLATQPWTRIYLEGRELGVTPLVDVELPAGNHRLRAVNPDKGIEREIEVEIRSGKTTARSVRF